MKEKLIEFLRSLSRYDAGLYLRLYYRLKNQQRLYKKHPDDRKFLEMMYKNQTGRELDLENPQRFTEKLQWLKLYNHNPLTSQCADKFLVRDYIESKGYGDLLNELLAHVEDVDDLDIDSLPERFVVKAAHSSAMNFICNDKKSVNWKSKKRIFKLWLKLNLYLDGREWVYKNLKPSIVVEKYLEDDSGYLRDYKFFCMNGKVAFVQADEDRYSDHKQSYYSTEWEKLDFTTGVKDCEVKRPENLEKMLEIASRLSEDFPFVRVDLYNCNGRIYFGELTFFGGSGFYSFDPDEYDFRFGSMVRLPEKTV